MSIKRVRLVRFKRFDDETFDLAGQSVVLAGPNNSGKTTLLHAIAAWELGLRRWILEGGGNGRRTRRISITLDEFSALPLREMKLLWPNRHTVRRSGPGGNFKAAPIYIEVVADDLDLAGEQSLTLEFLYASEKLLYMRPVVSPDDPKPLAKLPDFAARLQVVHVPPFSGIGTSEPRHSVGIQKKLIGEGKPGDIVRNLILDIWERAGGQESKPPWSDLVRDIKRLFQYELLRPEFSTAHPYIVCEYRAPLAGRPGAWAPPLDIANAGSGFHQALLLLSFFYARPSSVLLLDEPDAHLHFILQSEVLDVLRQVAENGRCKLVIATHAEALLGSAEPNQIVSFVGRQPRRLLSGRDRSVLTSALRDLTSLDLLRADHVGAVLYVEDESDYKILREFAVVKSHPAQRFLSFPFVRPLRGKGNLGDAKRHFNCLRLAFPEIRGLCLLDRDAETGPEAEDWPGGLRCLRGGRYEIENYLLNPELAVRYLQLPAEELFFASDARSVEKEFQANFPPGVNYLSDIAALRDIKGGDFLVKVLAGTSRPLAKRDLFMLAARATPDEIHPDVEGVLNKIADMAPAMPPAIAANFSPEPEEGAEETDSGAGEGPSD